MKKFLLVCGSLLCLSACNKEAVMEPVDPVPLPSYVLETKKIRLNSPSVQGVDLTVEVADSAMERELGLMNRLSLAENSGMLFVFEEQHMLTFWMKNTNIALDIIFFDREGKFVSYKSMLPCKADPCETYSSEKPAMYAIEVRRGFVGDRGIGEGWTLVQ